MNRADLRYRGTGHLSAPLRGDAAAEKQPLGPQPCPNGGPNRLCATAIALAGPRRGPLGYNLAKP